MLIAMVIFSNGCCQYEDAYIMAKMIDHSCKLQ